MNRDAVYREITSLIQQLGTLPFAELLELADEPTIDSDLDVVDDHVTCCLKVFRLTSDSVKIEVSAFSDDWWKLQRIDESVVVHRPQ